MTMQDLLAMFDIPTTYMTPEEEAYLYEQQRIAAEIAAAYDQPYQNQITPPSLPGAGMAEGRPQAVINPQYDVPVSAAPDPYAQYTSGANNVAIAAAEAARLAQMGSQPMETFDYGTELQNYATQNYGELPTMGPPAGGAFSTSEKVGGSGTTYSDSSGATGQAPGFLLGPMLGLTPEMRQAGIERENQPGIIGQFLENLSDIPLLSFPTGGGARDGGTPAYTVGDAADATLGTAYDTYMYDIPYVSDFMRETVQPFVGDVGGFLGGQVAEALTPRSVDPALTALGGLIFGQPTTPQDVGSAIGRTAAEALVPVTAGDFAVELIPGIGSIPDLARIAPDLARGVTRGLDQAAIRAAGDNIITVYHVPSSDEGLESILRNGLNPGTAVTVDREMAETIAERWGLEPLEFKVRASTLEPDAWYQRTTTPLQVGGTGAEGGLRTLVGAEAGASRGGNPLDPRSLGGPDNEALMAETIRNVVQRQHDSIADNLDSFAQLSAKEQADPDRIGGVKRAIRNDLTKMRRNLGGNIPPEYQATVTRAEAFLKSGTVPAPPKPRKQARAATSSTLRAEQVTDFDPARDIVVRRDGQTFIEDTRGEYAPMRVQSDQITPEYEANIAKLTPQQRARMAEETRNSPYLSPEGKAERLQLLTDMEPTSRMTPEAVSAIRRRRKGGQEIPVAQDPMAPASGTTTPAVPAGVATASPPPPTPPIGTGAAGAGSGGGPIPPRETPPTDDFAGNIRLSKYPDDIREPIKTWADANPDVVQSARRGTLPDEQVEQMARDLVNDLGGDFNKLQRSWKPGEAWNAEEIVAIRGSLNDATRKVMDAAETARTADTTANQLALTEAILEQQRIQQIVHGVTAEAGRSLRAFKRQAAEAMAGDNLQRMQELMRRALNANSEQDVTNITEMIRALDLDDPQAVNAFLRNINKPGVGDYLYELWINSVLSGPITHLRNIFGNAAATLYSPVERLGAVPADAVAARIAGRKAERFWQEAPAAVLGMAHGLPDGVRGAVDVLRHGFNPEDVGRLEIRRQAFTGPAGRVIRFPTNALEAMDAFFHSVNYRSSLYADAVRQARKEGLSDVALRNRIAELIHEPTTQMVKHSSNEAERLLFRDDPGQFATKLMSLRESTPGLKYVLPFIKTPANLLKYGVKHSPLGLLDAPMWRKFAAGNPEAADEVSRTVMGSMIGASLGGLIATGQLDITGAIPVDSAERDRFYREGKLPFSVKIPGLGWVQYNQIPILDTTLTSVASVVEGLKSGQDVTGIASNTAGIIAQSILDKSYLNGLADFFDAIADPARYAERFATRTITGFVPFSAALRQTAQSIDRTVRTPEGFVENLQAGIPGLTGNVPARIDAFGNEATRPQPSPLQISPDKQSAIDAELGRLGTEIGFVGDSIGGVGLNREQQSAFQKVAGERTAAALDALINDPRYADLTDGQRVDAIEKQRDMARNSVRNAFNTMVESPDYKNATPEQRQQLTDMLFEWLDQGWNPGEATPAARQNAPPMDPGDRYEDGSIDYGKLGRYWHEMPFQNQPLRLSVEPELSHTSSESLQAATAKVLQQQGIDPRFAAIVPTREMTPEEAREAGGFFVLGQPVPRDRAGNPVPSALQGGGSNYVGLPNPTFSGIAGRDDWQQSIVMHEMTHAFESLLTEDERAQLEALMEKNPTLLTSLGYGDSEYHPGALTRYMDQWGSGMSMPFANEPFIAGSTPERAADAYYAASEQVTNRTGQIPADLINFINRLLPAILERAKNPAFVPPEFK